MAFTPTSFTKGGQTRIAATPREAVWLEFTGWVRQGAAALPTYVDELSGTFLTKALAKSTYASALDAANLRRLTDLAASDRSKSLAASRIAYEDAASFTESWTDLTAWSSGTAVQVSAGSMFSLSSGAGSGINHSFPLAAGDTMRAVFNVTTRGFSASGGLIIGVNSDAAGAAATAGGTKLRGIYFAGGVSTFDQGAITSLGALVGGTVNWTVTLTVDLTYITITAVSTDGSAEFRTRWTRAGFTINNIGVFNSDNRNLTGHSLGKMAARKAIATVAPRTGLEGVAPRTVHWTAVGNAGLRIALPPSYDSRKPCPVAICFHGNGSDETTWYTNANGKVVGDALLAAGYIVVSAAHSPNLSTWGAQASLDAYYAAYQFARDNYAIGPVVLYANSMGGIESLLTLAERRIPGIAAWAGTSPTADLANNYANATFTATINTAYGISGDYAAKTAGHDPMLLSGDKFRGVPMLFLAATDDATVSKAANTDAMAAKVAPFSPLVTVQAGITGGHSFNFTPYTGQIVSFFNACVAG